MASDTIKGAGDIYEKDLFDNLSKSAKETEALIEALNKTLKQTTKINEKLINSEANTVEELNKLNKGLQQTDDSYRNKLKLDKERFKLEQKLANGRTKEAQANEEIKIQISEETKERKRLAKETLKLTGAYAKESKKLNDLRKQYKDLVLSEGKATKETKKLGKQITKLDKELKEVDAAAGQFQRNVGNYPDSLGDATAAILGVAAAAISAQGAFEGVKGSLESTAEGSENVREVTSVLAGVWDQLSNTVAAAALDTYDYGKAVVESVQSGEGLIDSLKKTDGQYKRTATATDDFSNKVKDSIEGQVGVTNAVIAFEKAIRPLENRLSVLNGLIQQQQIIAGDSTRSFNELETAILKGQELQIERAGITVNIAREELAIAKERVRVANLSGGGKGDLLDAEAEAVRALIEAENDLKNEVLENDKELRQIKQDRLEIELDILIDGFDNQKTINERIIANEKETLEKRNKLFQETTRLADKSFEGQKEVLQDLSKVGIDVEDLLSLDATELAKEIQLLEQSEISNTRTLEVIRERRIVLQDLEDVQRDLNEAEQEGVDLQKDITAQNIALAGLVTANAVETEKLLKTLEDERKQDNIDNLTRKLSLEKDGSIAFLNIQKELNDALLDQQKQRLDEEKAAEDKALEDEKNRAEEKKAIQDALLTKLEDSLQKRSNARIEDLDEQFDASKENENRLRDLAAKGSLDAQQSISVEAKKQADLKRAKEKEERKQELVSAGFKIFSSLLDQGKNPQDATLETAALLGALPAIIEAIPTAFEGTESTGTVKNQLDSNGGRLMLLHDNERVMTEKQNNKMGGIGNDEAANIIEKYNMGELFNHNSPDISSNLMSSINLNGLNKGLERKIDTLNESIKAIKMPKTSMEADYVRQILKVKTQTGNKIITEISKLH